MASFLNYKLLNESFDDGWMINGGRIDKKIANKTTNRNNLKKVFVLEPKK